MEYITAQDAAIKWGITKRRVQFLCSTNRIDSAFRIGNMWLLPASAQKPSDARYKNKSSIPSNKKQNPIRIARSKIKAISTQGMKMLTEEGFSFRDAKMTLIMLFALELIINHERQYSSTISVDKTLDDKILPLISKITNYQINNSSPSFNSIRQKIYLFVKQHSWCCDDALSWCYQYANKFNPNATYRNTQFFTEKYMISSIVDSIRIESDAKILDFACGGANFLLYCIDILAEQSLLRSDSKIVFLDKLYKIYSMLYGYEIDQDLATVASLNLRLKGLSLSANYNHYLSFFELESFCPNIYFPETETLVGALDVDPQNQIVIKCGTSEKSNLNEVLRGTTIIITNPPFQTIKGMDPYLKSYLKTYYPNSKCDMCNAFIELSIRVLSDNGIAGLVTQNSWMYLDSFVEFRKKFLSTCSIQQIVELGSNAFYDLNGEKTNVALLVYNKSTPTLNSTVLLTSLKNLPQSLAETLIASPKLPSKYTKSIIQDEIFNNSGSKFDLVSSSKLKQLVFSTKKYSDFATPMQGTSTGNAKELISFWWKHIGDSNWRLVSKGGGYARWGGLNHYSVKWGINGEFIKDTKGSAIRNANYFPVTELVYSDTGTAGLNVRKLLSNEIFVASGPGIRISQGDPYAHLSFLNSRFASYYIKLFSPKYTLAAGYISQIPTKDSIIFSPILSEYGKKCVNAKNNRLQKRPFNFEFIYIQNSNEKTIEEHAYQWFKQDLDDEWIQLYHEQLSEDIISFEMGLENIDLDAINNFIGTKNVFSNDASVDIDDNTLETILSTSLDANCSVIRTKADKGLLGCDGIIEFLSQKTNLPCESLYRYIITSGLFPEIVRNKYVSLYLHALTMSVLDYKNLSISCIRISELINKMDLCSRDNTLYIKKWLATEFNTIHHECFLKSPIFTYNKINDSIELIGGLPNE